MTKLEEVQGKLAVSRLARAELRLALTRVDARIAELETQQEALEAATALMSEGQPRELGTHTPHAAGLLAGAPRARTNGLDAVLGALKVEAAGVKSIG